MLGRASWGVVVATTVIHTEDAPAGARVDFWRDVVRDTMLPVDLAIDPADPLRGRLVHLDLGATQIDQMTTSPVLVRRTPKLIRAANPPRYRLKLQTRGASLLRQGGREAVLRPGDLVVTDPTRPYDLVAGYRSPAPGGPAHQELKFVFPHDSWPLSVDEMARLTAVRFPTRAPLTRLVAPILRHLLPCADHDTAVAVRLTDVLLDLLATGLAGHLGRGRAVAPESYRRALLTRIHAFIEQNLGRPDLSPQMIADAHHISLRYLHKLFGAEATTVAERIRRRRLERCRRELADPANGSLPVAAVALRSGFGTPEHFTRLFRATYGVPPGEYRRELTGRARS